MLTLKSSKILSAFPIKPTSFAMWRFLIVIIEKSFFPAIPVTICFSSRCLLSEIIVPSAVGSLVLRIWIGISLSRTGKIASS